MFFFLLTKKKAVWLYKTVFKMLTIYIPQDEKKGLVTWSFKKKNSDEKHLYFFLA